MASADFDPERLLVALRENHVRFILIGGMAAILHGDVGVTIDLDIVPEHERDNLERLANALRALEARIRTRDAREGRRQSPLSSSGRRCGSAAEACP